MKRAQQHSGRVVNELRKLGIPDNAMDRVTVKGRPLVEVFAEEEKAKLAKRPQYKSKAEQLMAWDLEEQQKAGEIESFQYEGMKFKLVESTGGKTGCWYTPDFCVWVTSGDSVWIPTSTSAQIRCAVTRLRCIEVKGFLREAARLRFLMARQTYPHIEWVMLRRAKTGWERVL